MARDPDKPDADPHADVIDALRKEIKPGPEFDRAMAWLESKSVDEHRLDECCRHVSDAEDRDPMIDRRLNRHGRAIATISTLLLVACGAGAFVVAGGAGDGIVFTKPEIVFTHDPNATFAPIDRPDHPGIVIETDDIVLVSFGKADTDDLFLSSKFHLKEYGYAGFFLGLRQDKRRDVPSIVQLIEVCPIDGNAMWGCRVTHQILKIYWDDSSRPKIEKTIIAMGSIDGVDMTSVHSLSVRIKDHRVVISFDGKQPTELTPLDDTADVGLISFRGQFGVFADVKTEVLRPQVKKD